MSDEIKQDRSPRSPKFPLEEAINYTRKLYDNAGRSVIPREMAAKAMGYGGLNGAALTTLATLSQYGLLEKQGTKLGISQLALKIFHPDAGGADSAIKVAALTPSVFSAIFENHHQLSESLLANHLVHQGFTKEASIKAASVYKENSEFAKLDNENILVGSEKPLSSAPSPYIEPINPVLALASLQPIGRTKENTDEQSDKKVLAQYSIPLGSNEAKLVFTGSELTADDFDALIDFVTFSKRQFERAQKSKIPQSVYPITGVLVE